MTKKFANLHKLDQLPIRVDPAEVFAKAEQAYKDGRLQATANPAVACTYRDKKGIPCAIGASFTDAQVKQLEQLRIKREGELEKPYDGNDASVRNLMADGVFVVESESAREMIKALQTAHDSLSSANAYAKAGYLRGGRMERASELKAKFEATLAEARAAFPL